ncbi:MAG: hypothetical protein CML68_09345 [Rhodobacteraceae bacterium]|nr:hypothetical protein [Paracoccaceae bacterium]
MPKIDNITYPPADERLLKNKDLGFMYRVFLKKRAADENWMFLDTTAKKIDPRTQYPVYFDDKGKYAINVDSKIKLKAKELAEAEAWKSNEWKKVYADSRKSINKLMEVNFEADFYKSPAFKEFHQKALYKAIRIPKGLKDQMKMDDDSLLLETVVMFMADKKAGAKAAKNLSARKKTPLSPDQIRKAIGKFFKLA